MKGRVLAIEAGLLLILGAANIVSDRLLGAAILIALGLLAATCAWALWPAGPDLATTRAAGSLRKAGSSRRPRR
jgi:hypothetical protein